MERERERERQKKTKTFTFTFTFTFTCHACVNCKRFGKITVAGADNLGLELQTVKSCDMFRCCCCCCCCCCVGVVVVVVVLALVETEKRSISQPKLRCNAPGINNWR